jgi:hypothetical protein
MRTQHRLLGLLSNPLSFSPRPFFIVPFDLHLILMSLYVYYRGDWIAWFLSEKLVEKVKAKDRKTPHQHVGYLERRLELHGYLYILFAGFPLIGLI